MYKYNIITYKHTNNNNKDYDILRYDKSDIIKTSTAIGHIFYTSMLEKHVLKHHARKTC